MALVALDPTASHHAAPLAVRLIPGSDAAVVAPLWQSLEAGITGGLANSWEWTSTWIAHYGDLVPHYFALGERAGRPVGIALVTQGVGQKRGPVPVRTVHIGTAGEPAQHGLCVEYNRLLVTPQDRVDFARGLYAAVRASKLKWDEFALDGFVPEDAAPFLDQDSSFFVRREVCRTTDLAAIRAGGGDVIAALRKSARYSIRRSIRAFDPVTVEWAETPEQAMDILDELIVLHQRRWTEAGKAGAFASPRFVGFHRTLIGHLLPRDAAILFRVCGAQGIIGCLYGFVEHGRALFYQSGFATFDDERLSPGLVSHALCMQACLDRGLNEYDFLMGDARYKRDLSTIERELVWAVASRRGLKGRLLTIARQRRYGDNQVEVVKGIAGRDEVDPAGEAQS